MRLFLLLVFFTAPLLATDPFYHGSLTDGIECLEPRLRYTPGEETDSPRSVYASDLAAFAAARKLSMVNR